MEQKVIYDLGMNNGDDLPYYLKKATKVVGVEANPELCSLVERRFANEIGNGRLVIINCVLTNKSTEEKALFYIHKTKHILSQFPRPKESIIHNFKSMELPQRTASSIILEHGHPYYIKIDIEHYDQYVLREIWSQKIRPTYISVEMHDLIVYDILKEMGYQVFNIVEGKSVAEKYKDSIIVDYLGNTCNYSFPHHSAGPFGPDITNSPWMKLWQMNIYLKHIKPGWKDIHTSLENLSKDHFWWTAATIFEQTKKRFHSLGLRKKLTKIFYQGK